MCSDSMLCSILLDRLACRQAQTEKNLIYSVVLLSSLILWDLKCINQFSFRGITGFFTGMLLCGAGSFTAHFDFRKRRLLAILCFVFYIIASCLVFCGIDQRWVLEFLVWPAAVYGCYHFEMKEVLLISKAGKVSFEIYIWHYPLMVLLELACAVLDIQIHHSFFTMTLFLLVSWMVAFWVEKYIERPINRIVRRFVVCAQ